MKKKILFIVSNLESGGVSKSMASLMNVIDRDRYDVSLFILNPTGIFMDLLPKDLNIIYDRKTSLVCGSFPKLLIPMIKEGYLLLAILRIIQVIVSRFSRSWGGIILSKLITPLSDEYDTVVDFNGQHILYYMVDSTKAKKKVSFFHSDYAKWPYYYHADKRYLPKVDNIFTISDICVESMKSYFPEIDSKINLMENISSLPLITKMSQANVDDIDNSSISIITIGHLSVAKGTDLAIQAASILKERGVKFAWYFIGGGDKSKYYELIEKSKLSSEVHLLGLKVNPYPYIKLSDIFVLPSQFEGKSIALDEAKLLLKPTVVTNFSTVYDQFTDRVNGSICDMTPESLADSLEELINNTQLQEIYINNLKKEQRDNSSEIEKLYQIFDAV